MRKDNLKYYLREKCEHMTEPTKAYLRAGCVIVGGMGTGAGIGYVYGGLSGALCGAYLGALPGSGILVVTWAIGTL